MKARLSKELKALLSDKKIAREINAMLLDREKNQFYIRYDDKVYKIHKRDIKSFYDFNELSYTTNNESQVPAT